MNGLAAWWLRCAALALVSTAVAGCTAPLASTYLSGSRRQEAQASTARPAGQAPDPDSPKAAALRKATGQQPATPEEALAGVLGELQEIGAIDPQAQQELMADLKAAKPEHYQLIVEQFESALAYRRQLAQRELDQDSELATDQPAGQVELASHQAAKAEAAGPRVVERRERAVEPVEKETAIEQEKADDSPGSGTTRLAQVSYSQPAPPKAAQRGDWRAELDATIAELERTVRPQPASVAELHDHMRLRTLQLLAGREEEAYRPIPGTSPAQQDFWSKQLFAMSAYLNGAEDLDDKQRAAGALLHLDEARAALSELATLQVRNITFVKSVDGFGAYEPLAITRFQPGEQVALYAEVENFRSESGEDGYRTALATSYQVVDKSGRRVEGGQFPEISDICKSRRRDFHMQYGVALPKRIYAGEYELELIITDQQSGKIGRASLPFEIVAER